MAGKDPRITELFNAIRRYNSDRVEELLAEGLSTEVRNQSSSTPLMLAGRMGSLNTFKALLGAGADVNARDNRGKSVMHHSCSDIADYQIRELIARGADDESIVQGLVRSAERGRDGNLVALMQARPDIMLQKGMVDRITAITQVKKRPMSTKAIDAFIRLYPLSKWASVQAMNDALETISPSTRKLFRTGPMISAVHAAATKRHRLHRVHRPRI